MDNGLGGISPVSPQVRAVRPPERFGFPVPGLPFRLYDLEPDDRSLGDFETGGGGRFRSQSSPVVAPARCAPGEPPLLWLDRGRH